jgi:hypothetical protein
VVLVVYIVTSGSSKPTGGEAKPIPVAKSNVVTKQTKFMDNDVYP